MLWGIPVPRLDYPGLAGYAARIQSNTAHSGQADRLKAAVREVAGSFASTYWKLVIQHSEGLDAPADGHCEIGGDGRHALPTFRRHYCIYSRPCRIIKMMARRSGRSIGKGAKGPLAVSLDITRTRFQKIIQKNIKFS